MKPLAIADYLDHLGRAPPEKALPKQETSPFRPRTLRTPQNAAPASNPVPDRTVKVGVPPAEERPQRSLWERKPVLLDSSPRQSPAAKEAVGPEEIAVRLAEAHARGREEGRAEGRAEASSQHAAEFASAQDQALTQQTEFRLNEYARLESVIRSGLAEIERNVGAAVSRILAPFLAARLLRQAVEELSKAIGRLAAGGSPGLITIRGPERVLAMLRQRIPDLPAEVEYVASEGVEAVIEAKATQIVTALGPWAELLTSFDD